MLNKRNSDIKGIQKALLSWFHEFQRPLPWRKNYDPYQVWISEIMLQQTQVKTVLPYFERWMKRLPVIESVAKAREDTVLKLWEGLGYYSRARNIRKAAKIIVEKFNNRFPDRYKDILSLPGIGRYTAAAIASIAFQKDYPVIDGNVIRVISRFKNFGGNTRLPANIQKLWKWAGELLPKGEARRFNQAMMELGALVCSPKNPHCTACPLQSGCLSFEKGNQEELPDRGKKIKTENIRVAIAVIRKSNKIFVQKRPESGLMAGLWEFPGGKIRKSESIKRGLEREIKEELGVTLKKIRPIMKIRHAYTRFKVDLNCFEAEIASGRPRLKAAQKGEWVKVADLKKYPFPAANIRLIEKLQAQHFALFSAKAKGSSPSACACGFQPGQR